MSPDREPRYNRALKPFLLACCTNVVTRVRREITRELSTHADSSEIGNSTQLVLILIRHGCTRNSEVVGIETAALSQRPGGRRSDEAVG
jgi:hypothetical protein